MKKIWIILDHPWQLFLALSIKLLSPANFEYGLIISSHKYWKRVDINPYREHFPKIYFFEEPARAHNFKETILFLTESHKLKRKVSELPIKPDNTFLTISYFRYLENIITSIFSKNKQVFLIREDILPVIWQDVKAVRASKKFRTSRSGLLHYYLLDPLLRLKKKTWFYWMEGAEKFHNTTYTKDITSLYDKVLTIHSIFHKQFTSQNIYYPYFILPASESIEKKRIVFFLSDYIKNENYYEKINIILKNLKNFYGDKYLLEIRLHPNNLEEYKKIYTTGWVINYEEGSGEEYLLRHKKDVVAAISHVSTILIFATSIGIPSFTYYRLFGFDENFVTLFERIFSEFPKEFHMSSFTADPEAYAIPLNQPEIKKSFENLISALS